MLIIAKGKNMRSVINRKTDKNGYDEHYKTECNIGWSAEAKNNKEFIMRFKIQHLTPFAFGGKHLAGNVRGKAVKMLFEHVKNSEKKPHNFKILDAGSGLGGLSVYLACHGYSVIGVEISETACRQAETLAFKFGVSDKCSFLSESLEKTSIADSSIDIIIGLHTFHHFIKYSGVPNEFKRVLKVGGVGYFADGFAENPAYRIFHNKEKMERLGDVLLNKKLITNYFRDFNVNIEPIDFFSMLNKFIVRAVGWKPANHWKIIAKRLYSIDQLIPKNRTTLFLSGTILTSIENIKK